MGNNPCKTDIPIYNGLSNPKYYYDINQTGFAALNINNDQNYYPFSTYPKFYYDPPNKYTPVNMFFLSNVENISVIEQLIFFSSFYDINIDIILYPTLAIYQGDNVACNTINCQKISNILYSANMTYLLPTPISNSCSILKNYGICQVYNYTSLNKSILPLMKNIKFELNVETEYGELVLLINVLFSDINKATDNSYFNKLYENLSDNCIYIQKLSMDITNNNITVNIFNFDDSIISTTKRGGPIIGINGDADKGILFSISDYCTYLYNNNFLPNNDKFKLQFINTNTDCVSHSFPISINFNIENSNNVLLKSNGKNIIFDISFISLKFMNNIFNLNYS